MTDPTCQTCKDYEELYIISNHPIYDYPIYTVQLEDGSNWHMYSPAQVEAFTQAIAAGKTPEQAIVNARGQ